MRNLRLRNEAEPFLVRLENNAIAVNETIGLKQLSPTLNRLAFHVVVLPGNSIELRNPNRLNADQIQAELLSGSMINDISYIEISLPIGESAKDLTNVEDIHLSLQGGWNASQWRRVDGNLVCRISYESSVLKLEALGYLAFSLIDIISYAPTGVSIIQLTFFNLWNSDVSGRIYKDFPVHKYPAPVQIHSLSPLHPVILPGAEAILNWKVSAVQTARISPGEFTITEGAAEYRRVLQKPEEFCLRADRNKESVSLSTYVYMVPPFIKSFVLNTARDKVAWDTAHASEVRYMGAVKEGAAGNSSVSSSQEKAELSCVGYRYRVDRSIYFPRRYKEISVLEKTILDFGSYLILQLNWEAQDLKSLCFVLGDTSNLDSQRVNKGTSGWWEIPLESCPPITAIGQKADNTTFQIPL
ncbi:MAG: hypothetical protein P4L49_09940 [Desulfosporosinus sp.]|nr:hypothetical protein [Desulfosporosinus sp.]